MDAIGAHWGEEWGGGGGGTMATCSARVRAAAVSTAASPRPSYEEPSKLCIE